MKLVRYEQLATEDTLQRFGQTRLKGYGEPLVYRTAKLELFEHADTNMLFPAQRYVLQRDLDTIFALEEQFSAVGVDIFSLTGAVLFWLELSDGTIEGPIPLCPPVVEISKEAPFRAAARSDTPLVSVALINDGMHRISAARARNRRINVVLISGDISHPYYAKPLPNGWADVKVISEFPANFVKKEYRDPKNYRDLFRDFNAVFPGIQKQRHVAATIIGQPN